MVPFNNPEDTDDDDFDEDDLPTKSAEELSQYDILVCEIDSDEALDFIPTSCSDPPPPHVGNNRLKVFLKMNMHQFNTATSPEEQQRVIDTILSLVQSQASSSQNSTAPTTTTTMQQYSFWKQQSGGVWIACSTAAVRSFLLTVLEEEQQADIMQAAATAAETTDDDEKKRRRRSSLLRRSLSSGNMIEDQKKRVAYRRSVLMQLETLDVSDDETDDEEDIILRRKEPSDEKKEETESHAGNGIPNPALESKESTNENNEIDKSVKNNGHQEKPLGDDQQDNASVSTEIHSNSRGLTRSSSLTSLMDAASSSIITAEALDVILHRRDDTNCPYELVANHTGNNRLLVMIHQRANKYEDARSDSLQVSKLCRELVETVQTFYNGRFLVEQQQETKKDDLTPSTFFIKLTVDQAATALASIFRLEIHPKPVTKQSAMEAIAALSAGTAVEAHKTALDSLKQKKKRQDTQNKITQNYARFGGGDSSSSLGSSTTTGVPDSMMNAQIAERRQHPMLAGHRAHSVGMLGIQQQQVPEPLMAVRRASLGIMPARRPTLSAFSAGMIQDMLHRLDVEAEELERQREFNNQHLQYR